MKTIGKNYDTTLQYINDPAKSEYFVPDPAPTMSCDVLQANYDKLTQQMEFWADAISELKFGLFSGDKIAAANISKIMDNQGAKLGRYTESLAACAAGDVPGAEPGTPTPGAPGTPTPSPPAADNGSGSGLLLAGLVLGGVYLFTRKKKQRRKK